MCVQDQKQPWFRLEVWNLTKDQLQDGVQLWMAHGAGPAKDRVVLTHHCLVAKVRGNV